MLTNDNVRESLERFATFIDETDAVRRYVLGPHPIAFRLKSKDPYSGLAVSRAVAERLSAHPLRGLTVGRALRNSNYLRFPVEANEKGIVSHVGIRLEVEDEPALNMLIDVISSDFYEVELVSQAASRNTPVSTERWAVALARNGQGQFRRDLLSFWRGGCALTGVAIHALLEASHIKPWFACNDDERLSPENGLLLTANLHSAFDSGLIGFRSDGTVLLSEVDTAALIGALGIPFEAKLRLPPSPAQREYLSYHRENVFLKDRRQIKSARRLDEQPGRQAKAKIT